MFSSKGSDSWTFAKSPEDIWWAWWKALDAPYSRWGPANSQEALPEIIPRLLHHVVSHPKTVSLFHIATKASSHKLCFLNLTTRFQVWCLIIPPAPARLTVG
jgi:hypothetical protein